LFSEMVQAVSGVEVVTAGGTIEQGERRPE